MALPWRDKEGEARRERKQRKCVWRGENLPKSGYYRGGRNVAERGRETEMERERQKEREMLLMTKVVKFFISY